MVDGTCVITICKVDSGYTKNVIPDTAFLGGTIRFLDNNLAQEIQLIITQLCQEICEQNNCKVEVRFKDEYPVTDNHEE